jgi:hypothetical protein
MTIDPRHDGKVLNVSALDVQVLPDDASALVLLDYMEMGTGPVPNLVNVLHDGSLMWVADLPNTAASECYVPVEVSATGDVIANTGNAFRVSIDAQTGKVLRQEFSK